MSSNDMCGIILISDTPIILHVLHSLNTQKHILGTLDDWTILTDEEFFFTTIKKCNLLEVKSVCCKVLMCIVGVMLEVAEADNEDVCHLWPEGVDMQDAQSASRWTYQPMWDAQECSKTWDKSQQFF